MKLLSALIGAAALAVIMAAGAAAQQSGTKPFCLQKGTAGTMDCAYDTMAQCKKAATGPTDSCSPRKATGDGTPPTKKK